MKPHLLATLVLLCGPLFVASLTHNVSAQRQLEENEAAMAEYADAANFQNNGATDLAIESWKQFLDKYPKNELASKAAHYLGVCYMQQKPPKYAPAIRAFEQAVVDREYDLRQESLSNLGFCFFTTAGSGGQDATRDSEKLRQAQTAFEELLKEDAKGQFADRALFYLGEINYGLDNAKDAVKNFDQFLKLPNSEASPLYDKTLYARGVALEELDQYEPAFDSYRKLMKETKDDGLANEVRVRMGDVLI
ncbi:MAG: tetratricopeptide repeat protein, partial [Planctomycetota bacterium]